MRLLGVKVVDSTLAWAESAQGESTIRDTLAYRGLYVRCSRWEIREKEERFERGSWPVYDIVMVALAVSVIVLL